MRIGWMLPYETHALAKHSRFLNLHGHHQHHGCPRPLPLPLPLPLLPPWAGWSVCWGRRSSLWPVSSVSWTWFQPSSLAPTYKCTYVHIRTCRCRVGKWKKTNPTTKKQTNKQTHKQTCIINRYVPHAICCDWVSNSVDTLQRIIFKIT